MKMLSVIIILALGTLITLATVPSPLDAANDYEPTDLAILQGAGLTDETIGRYLAQNLQSSRKAPPIESALLAELGHHGGDSLVSAYLKFDANTAHQASREFSPEVIGYLVKSGTPSDELKAILALENAIVKTQTATTPPLVSETTTILPLASEATPPAQPVPPSIQPQKQATVVPTRPNTNQVASPSRPEMGFQNLRPGQAADPAKRMAPPLSTYDIRRQPRDEGTWMGVTERMLPDGHVVEVNSIGYTAKVGQEVLSRPSGHQVYRYHTGNPDQPYSGEDLRQRQINQDNLGIIFGGERNN